MKKLILALLLLVASIGVAYAAPSEPCMAAIHEMAAQQEGRYIPELMEQQEPTIVTIDRVAAPESSEILIPPLQNDPTTGAWEPNIADIDVSQELPVVLSGPVVPAFDPLPLSLPDKPDTIADVTGDGSIRDLWIWNNLPGPQIGTSGLFIPYALFHPYPATMDGKLVIAARPGDELQR